MSDVRPLPLSADIEHYLRQATEEFAADSDATAALADWYHFTNWAALAHWVAEVTRTGSVAWQFETAVEAIIAGDVPQLARLLRENSGLTAQRSQREHQATLLIYVGANGVEGYRQKSPPNAVTIAQMLLDAGAEIDAIGKMYGGTTTLGLVATSVHPVVAGVQEPLMQLLLDRAASMDRAVAPDYRNGLVVNACLANGRPGAALFLAERGAKLDLGGAAGVGRLDVVRTFFAEAGTPKGAAQDQVREAFDWACGYGHIDVVELLLDKGIDLRAQDVEATALHHAAGGGHLDIVKRLIARGASVNAKDSEYDATPMEWALWGWTHPTPDAKAGRYHEVVILLRAAGSSLHAEWLANETLRSDVRMMAALSPQRDP